MRRSTTRRTVDSVLCVTRYSPDPMGQQSYESAILSALEPVLAGSELKLERATVGSLRSQGQYRLPERLLTRLPLKAAALLALWQRPGRLVHRMDLRIPPTLLGPEVVTVHDLPPLRFDDEGTMPRWSLASGAVDSCVITPSQFAADEVRTFMQPRRVEVIPYGVSAAFEGHRAPSPEVAESYDLKPWTYVVHAAGVTERKNLPELARAWKLVAARRPDLCLVLCGAPSPRRTSLFQDVPNVRLVGKLAPTAVAALMSTGLAVVVPSTYEGFGLPALEGMAVGAPVVAARRGALPEVCGDAAVLVEPDGASIAEAILDLAADESERERLARAGRERAQTFSWTEAAESHARVYREVIRGG